MVRPKEDPEGNVNEDLSSSHSRMRGRIGVSGLSFLILGVGRRTSQVRNPKKKKKKEATGIRLHSLIPSFIQCVWEQVL